MCNCGGIKYNRNKTIPVDTLRPKVEGVVKPSTLVNPAEPKPVRGHKIGTKVGK